MEDQLAGFFIYTHRQNSLQLPSHLQKQSSRAWMWPPQHAREIHAFRRDADDRFGII